MLARSRPDFDPDLLGPADVACWHLVAGIPGNLEMGTGAVMATSLFSATDLNQQGSPIAGPMAVLIAVAPGVRHDTALRSLDHITAVLNGSADDPVGGVVGALRPAEIANYRTLGATPALLAAVLAAGAIGALGLTLVASVCSAAASSPS